MWKIGEYLAGQSKTTFECAEYLTTAFVGGSKVVLLDVHDANDVTVFRDRFKALLLLGPQVIVGREVSSGALLRFHARPSGVILRGALAEGKRMARRENGRGAPAPLADGLAVPGGVVHTAFHSPRPWHPSGGLRYNSKRAPASLSPGPYAYCDAGLLLSDVDNRRSPMVGGAWLLSESYAAQTEDYVFITDVKSFLRRSSVIWSHGLCLLNGVCVRAEWVKRDDTGQYVQDRLGLLRRLLRPAAAAAAAAAAAEMLNAGEGCSDDGFGSALDDVVTPRGTPADDTSGARILGIDTDAHIEAIRAFPEASSFGKKRRASC